MGENIFTDIYNKVIGFFRQTDAEETAKDTACNRLRVVLMQDRTNLNPQLLEKMRKELIELLSKYVEMDKDALELNFEQEGEQMALMLSIPVLRAKSAEDIEKALEEELEEKPEDAETETKDADSETEDENAEEDEAAEEEESEEEISKEDENKSEDEK